MNTGEKLITDITVIIAKKSDALPPHIVSQLQESLHFIMKSDGLGEGNLIHIVTMLMRDVAQYKGLSGSQKKEIVVVLINEAIEEVVDNEVIENTLQMLMSAVIPGAIDIMVDLAKSNNSFNTRRKSCLSCLLRR
jgi:hypothetical protein